MTSYNRDEMRELWAEETDQALFEGLTIGRDRYTESALGVIAEEASRRGLTKPERMKLLAEELKAQGALSPAEPGQSGPDLIEFLPQLLKALAFLLAMLAPILIRIGIRRLF